MSTEIEKKDEDPSERFAAQTTSHLPDVAKMAVNYQRWHSENVLASADMVSGLAAANALALKDYIDTQLKILKDPVVALAGVDPEVAAVIMQAASDGFLKGSDILRRQALDSVKAAEVLNKVRRVGGSSESSTSKKAGFSKKKRPNTLAIKAEAGSTVIVKGDSEGVPEGS